MRGAKQYYSIMKSSIKEHGIKDSTRTASP